MKAIRIHEYGSSDVLKYEEVERPTLQKPNDVIVKIKATSINHLEVMVASGKNKEKMPVDFPWIPGYDFVGTIVESGPEVKHFYPGAEVYGKTTGGTYAEYILVDKNLLAKKPTNISTSEAASVPHVGLTAWQALFDHGQLKEGQKVLIHGAAGAVGSFAIQFAKNAGAYVYGTASAEDKNYLQSLQPDVIIDYKNEDFTNIAKDIDLVIDLVGGETQQKSYSVLKDNGRLVTTTGLTTEEAAKKYHVTAISMVVQPNGEELWKIAELIEKGKVKCDVALTYPLEQAKEAWDTYLHKNPDAPKFSHGKIVLEVK